MPIRMTEQYQIGDLVEIQFSGNADETWRPGAVVQLQHPGVWVRTLDGGLWYVTNGRRIRPCNDAPGDASQD